MGKWLESILRPKEAPEPEDHIAVEDLARMADGTVDREERRRFIRHLNCCQKCYEIFRETLTDLSAEAAAQPTVSAWRSTRTAYALAVCILLVFIIGGSLAYKYWSERPMIISATLKLDQDLKDILLEDDALRWEKRERIDRLTAALQQRGIEVKELNRVILSKPYYQKKSLFGPPEVLHVRIENDTAYLEVEEEQN